MGQHKKNEIRDHKKINKERLQKTKGGASPAEFAEGLDVLTPPGV